MLNYQRVYRVLLRVLYFFAVYHFVWSHRSVSVVLMNYTFQFHCVSGYTNIVAGCYVGAYLPTDKNPMVISSNNPWPPSRVTLTGGTPQAFRHSLWWWDLARWGAGESMRIELGIKDAENLGLKWFSMIQWTNIISWNMGIEYDWITSWVHVRISDFKPHMRGMAQETWGC